MQVILAKWTEIIFFASAAAVFQLCLY